MWTINMAISKKCFLGHQSTHGTYCLSLLGFRKSSRYGYVEVVIVCRRLGNIVRFVVIDRKQITAPSTSLGKLDADGSNYTLLNITALPFLWPIVPAWAIAALLAEFSSAILKAASFATLSASSATFLSLSAISEASDLAYNGRRKVSINKHYKFFKITKEKACILCRFMASTEQDAYSLFQF